MNIKQVRFVLAAICFAPCLEFLGDCEKAFLDDAFRIPSLLLIHIFTNKNRYTRKIKTANRKTKMEPECRKSSSVETS